MTEAECRARHGDWKIHGLARTPSCNYPTRDRGKLCFDGDDCEGYCVANEEPDIELVEPGPPARGRFRGRCSSSVQLFGCYRLVPRGASRAGAVELRVPPKKICFD
jgi:hypothetical protein